MGAGSDAVSKSKRRRLSDLVKPLAGVIPTAEGARNFGEAVASKALGSSREIVRRAEELAATSRSTLTDQFVSARGLAVKSRIVLQVTSANAVGLAGRAYLKGRQAAADPRVQQAALAIATMAVTTAIKRHPAGAFVSSAWSMIEIIGPPNILGRKKAAGSPRQGALPGSTGRRAWKRIGQTGGLASFTYVDADGVVTERLVRNWRSSGRLIKGHCLLRQEFRCFRVDRIEGWNELG